MYIIYCLIKLILFLTVLYLFNSHYNEIQIINLAIFYTIRSILQYIFIIIIKCKKYLPIIHRYIINLIKHYLSTLVIAGKVNYFVQLLKLSL